MKFLSFFNSLENGDIQQDIIPPPLPFELTASVEKNEKMKLMIVDDDEEIIKLIRFSLKNEAIQIHSYADPVKALNEMSKIAPDVVLVDLYLFSEFLLVEDRLKVI